MPRRPLIIIACGAVLAAAVWLVPTPTGDVTPAAVVSTDAAAHAGYRAFIDPATGGLTAHPTSIGAVGLDKDVANALSTSSEGLREEPSPVPGGGVMVDLRGRFRNATIATIDETGALRVPCVSGLPQQRDDNGEANHE
jgi:hypothetical protein